MSNIGIYKLTSPSGKIYIGQSINLINRFNKYKSNSAKGQSYLDKALKKYGFENFKIEMLFITNKKYKHIKTMLNALEIYSIKKYDSINPEKGYNLTKGGDGVLGRKTTDETKLKISIANKGLKRTDKQKEIMSLACIGRVVSSETKNKISNTMKSKIRTEEHKKNNGLANRIPIIQYSKSGEYIKEWTGAIEIEKELNINRSNICAVCKGNRKTTGGYIFKYKEDK